MKRRRAKAKMEGRKEREREGYRRPTTKTNKKGQDASSKIKKNETEGGERGGGKKEKEKRVSRIPKKIHIDASQSAAHTLESFFFPFPTKKRNICISVSLLIPPVASYSRNGRFGS